MENRLLSCFKEKEQNESIIEILSELNKSEVPKLNTDVIIDQNNLSKYIFKPFDCPINFNRDELVSFINNTLPDTILDRIPMSNIRIIFSSRSEDDIEIVNFFD